MKRTLHPDRFFSPDPATRTVAREIFQIVADLPIPSPHGHVDPRYFAGPNATFGTPANLFIIPDHYVTRMLYSQGVPLENLGVTENNYHGDTENTEKDNKKLRELRNSVVNSHRRIWRIFCFP